MISSACFTLREAADELGVESWRIARLARYLRIPPEEKCLPREDVERIKQRPSSEARYAGLRDWLLEHQTTGPSPNQR